MALNNKPSTDVKPKDHGKKHIGRNVALFILFVVIVVTFVFTGFNRGGGSGQSATGRVDFGTYKGTPIYFEPGNFFSDRLQRAMAEYERQQPAQPGETEDQAKQRRDGIMYYSLMEAYSQATYQTVVLRDVKDSGYDPVFSTSFVDKLLKRSGEYFGQTVTQSQFNNMAPLEREKLIKKLSDEYYVRMYYSELFAQGYLPEAVSFGHLTSAKEVEFIKSMAATERSFEYVFFPLSSYPDSEVKAYGEKNAGLFKFMKVSKIAFDKSLEEAQKLIDEMKAKGTSFEDMAKTYSVDEATKINGGIVVEPTYFNALEKAFADPKDAEKVTALKAGELSVLLKGATGNYLLYRCDEAIKDADFAKAETLAGVRKYIEDNAKSEIETWVAAKAEEFRKAALAGGFAASAAAAKLAVKTIDPFSCNYSYANLKINKVSPTTGEPTPLPFFKTLDESKAPEFAGLSEDEKFITACKALKAGEVSEGLMLYPSRSAYGTTIDTAAGVAVLVLKGEAAADPINLANFENSWPEFIIQKTLVLHSTVIMRSKDLVDRSSDGIAAMLKSEG